MPENNQVVNWGNLQDFAAETKRYVKESIDDFGIASKEDVEKSLAKKVDKVEGKQLSTNDFTNADKQKLDDTYTKIESESLIDIKITETAEQNSVIHTELQEQINNIVLTSTESGDVTSEVVQARVSVDGTNYETLKARIDAEQNILNSKAEQSEVDELRLELIECKAEIIGVDESSELIWSDDFFDTININKGGYIDSSDGVSIVSHGSYGYTDYINIEDYMLIRLAYNTDVRLGHMIYVYDENMNYLAKSGEFVPVTGTPFVFTGYPNAKYMRFSVSLSNRDLYELTTINRSVYGANNFKSISRSMSIVSENIKNGKSMSGNIINLDGMMTATFVNNNDTVTYLKEALETGFSDVSAYEMVRIDLNDSLSRGRAVKFYDESGALLQYNSIKATTELAVPDGAKKMRMTIFSYTNDNLSDIPFIKMYGIYGNIPITLDPPYQGKKFSLLGDSITTFSGYLYPSENVSYYTGSNAGVSAVSDTWWHKLINALGGQLEKNNSWSGSAVSAIRGGYPKSGVERCIDLGNPDVIIVRLGTNDFYFGAELGTYDGTTAIPTTEATFSDAYGKMLGLIMDTYKTAEIWVCTMTQFERLDSTGYPETNTHGETIAEWNERIRTIAKALGAKILDDAMCGMTYQNIGVYTDDQDYETNGNGLHPNAAGHSLIANNCIRTMDASCRVRY